MNQYVTGAIIKKLREEKRLTQSQLAERLCVSDKTVSKWETGKGYPDITLIEPIAEALDISVIELMNGENIVNRNRSSNMLRSKLYVCPVCGNVITSMGDTVVSCCGITLPVCEAEQENEEHGIRIENVEDEYYITADHPMTKEHYISFIAAVSDDTMQMVKLYPEGPAEARVNRRKVRRILYYCNRHGLFSVAVKK